MAGFCEDQVPNYYRMESVNRVRSSVSHLEKRTEETHVVQTRHHLRVPRSNVLLNEANGFE